MISAYESDFFSHREEKLEWRAFFHLSDCHHGGNTHTIIGSERGFVSSQYFPVIDDFNAFFLEIMTFIDADTHHVHMWLETKCILSLSRSIDHEIAYFILFVFPFISLGPLLEPLPDFPFSTRRARDDWEFMEVLKCFWIEGHYFLNC